ncbi:MAG: putative DNA-binding domain-containing protein [Tatlockia sp.]|nr:putative DNA-binding domain-containing protein [Tatlockia sp.]
MKPSNLDNLLQDTMLSAEPLIHPHLAKPPKGSLEARVAIYTEGFYTRLEDTLASDYSALAFLLAGGKFKKLCRAYTDTHPSCHYSLNSFGQHMESFIKANPVFNKTPYLAELARFEWAESQAIIAADATLLRATDLQALPPANWPELVFSLHPSSCLLRFDWNSIELIEAIRSNNQVPKPKKLKKPQSVLVWRRQTEVLYCKLNARDYTLVKAMKAKANFLELCELLSKKMPEAKVPPFLVKELYAWLSEELFIKE